MGFIKISEKANQNLKNAFSSDNVFKENSEILKLSNLIRHILNDNLYVVIKNAKFVNNKINFERLIKLFGEYYGEIEFTNIKINCNYTGCDYKYIPFHNDDAIDINHQPTYGFIKIVKNDPLLLGINYIVKAEDIYKYLKFNDKEFLKILYKHKFPMLAFGINQFTKKDKIEIYEPILYENENGLCIRFDLQRIKFYYKFYNKKQSFEEEQLLYQFLNLLDKLKTKIHLLKNDIFIHNNLKTLHNRGICSFEIDDDINTREIWVSFAR